jgi:hypothetical protein
MRKLALSTILFFSAASLNAQTPLAVQTCVISNGAGNQGSYTCTFSQPNVAGSAIVIPEVGVLASITDSNKNTYVQDTSTPQLGFWHALNIAPGPNTVTLTLKQPGAIQALLTEYAGVSGISVSSVASGLGTGPLSPALPAAVGNIVLGFGSQWTNSYQVPSAAGSGFTFEKNGPLWLEDKTVSVAGNVIASAIYSSPVNWVNWYTGVAVLNLTPPIPPTYEMVTFPLHVRYCTLCDGTDDTSTGLNILTGLQIQLAQGQSNLGTFVLNSTGDVTAKGGIDVTQFPIVLNFTFLDPTGSVLPQCKSIVIMNYPAPPNACLQIAFDPTTLGYFSTVNGVQFWNAQWYTLNMALLLDSKNAAPRGSRQWTSP